MTTAEFETTLRERGHRVTPQRQLVYEAIERLGHATPEEVLNEVQRTASGINLSTVYRTIDVLEEVGLVRHAHLGHGSPTFHIADDSHHMHLVCRDCGKVIEVDAGVAGPLVGTLSERFGFTTDVEHFAIYGLCAGCAALDAAATDEE